MKEESKKEVQAKVRETLDHFLEAKSHRKTPERYAILDAIYEMEGHFTIDELSEVLRRKNFQVSRATLYNALRLFLSLRLVVRHCFSDGLSYEASYDRENHCHQICTICGKVTEIAAPLVTDAIEGTHTRRFRKEVFTLYIYGVCSSCLARQTRMRNAKNKKKITTKK